MHLFEQSLGVGVKSCICLHAMENGKYSFCLGASGWRDSLVPTVNNHLQVYQILGGKEKKKKEKIKVIQSNGDGVGG